MDVLPAKLRRQSFGTVVHKIPTGLHRFHILAHALRVYAHHQVNTLPSAQIAFFADAYFIPGRQSLDVGGENIFWTDGNTHSKNRLGKEEIRTGGPGAVHIGKTHDKFVYLGASICI